MLDIIIKWQTAFGINDWDIVTNRIHPDQVTYADDCPLIDRYFIGIQKFPNRKYGVIYHDRDLYEEAIIHELLHVRYPDKDEEWIDRETTIIYTLSLLNSSKEDDIFYSSK